MHIKTRTALTALTLTTATILASCSTTSPADPTTVTSSATTADAGAESTEASSIEPTPEPTLPAVGEAVAKDAVEALRDQGVNIYLPTSSDTGIVVDPAAPLPEAVVNDILATKTSTPGVPEPDVANFGITQNKITAVTREMQRAGLSAFYIQFGGDYDASGTLTAAYYLVDSHNVPGFREWVAAGNGTLSDSREGALLKAQPIIDANPGVPIIDLTE